MELEEEEGWGAGRRQGRFLGAALSQGSPCASCSQMGHPAWLYPLRVLPCSWSPHGSCSWPQRSLECSRMAPGAGTGSSRDIPATESLLMSPCPRPCPHPSGRVVTQGCHRLKGLGWALKTIPVPFPSLLGAGWTWQGLELLPTGRGTAPARHLRGNLSLD